MLMTGLERRARALLEHIPKVPIQHLETTGEFWLAVMRLRTELRVLEAMREEDAKS